jgi:hypothetical protein
MQIFSRFIRALSRFIRASYFLGPRKLYLTVWRAANAETPKVALKESEHGVFFGLENDYLFRAAVCEGSNEPHFHELARLLIRPSDTVLDIGSNMGTHSILLSRLVSEGHVFAFEP